LVFSLGLTLYVIPALYTYIAAKKREVHVMPQATPPEMPRQPVGA